MGNIMTLLRELLSESKKDDSTTIKPRNKPLHDALRAKRGKAIPADKVDYNRNKDKQQHRKDIAEAD